MSQKSLAAIVGSWKLISWLNRSEDGEVNYPLGKDAIGYISYHPDGYMFVHIMTAARANFAAADLLAATAAEKAKAAETHIAYCGSYELLDSKVIHHVKVSSFPNWVGTSQERVFSLKDNRLELSTAPILLEGKTRTAHLIWERV